MKKNMNQQDKKRIFAKFFAGVTTVQDEKHILNTSEINEMMLEQWNSNPADINSIPKPDLYKILATVYRRVMCNNQKTSQNVLAKKIIYHRLLAAAALVLMLLSVGSFFWYSGVIPGKDIVSVSAPKGVRAEIFLPDGSRVWLNSGSTLKYDKNFNSTTRKLTLEGEAYFNIAHNPSRPMHVKTKLAIVEVLGTRFNLVSLPKQNVWEATLEKGSIRVDPVQSNRYKRISLTPGSNLKWNGDGNQFVLSQVNTTQTTRWVSNQFRFENETFGSIAKQLEHAFGVQIYIPSHIKENYRFTAKFTDESIVEILNLLKISAPFNYAFQGNRVVVSVKE